MKKSSEIPQKYYVPALEKGLDVLEVLAAAQVPQSLSDLARRLGRTSSELFRMLNALERRRYIERDSVSGKYRLTLRLYQLAHTHSPVEKLLRPATMLMRTLAEKIKESCHVSILDGHRLVVLAQADSPAIYRFSVEVGSAFSPLCTASGRLLLAHCAEEEFRHFCETSEEYRRWNGTARKKLAAQLDEVRRRGFSTAHNEPIIGIRSYAVLVGKPEINLAAALAVASLDMRGKKDNGRQILEGLKTTAARINCALGLLP
ncbi:MAG TPA: IclR family transcriptional regulator [Terriglobia bacterium]|nr:IclR family transcriptional regulator [Terriglobia bacterium]